jgi:signal transduction histidine kinase
MREYKYKNVIRPIALISILVGTIVIMGWIFNVQIVTTVCNGYVSMKFNSAICFVLSGSFLLLFSNQRKYSRLCQIIFSTFIIVIGISSFSEYFFKYSIGIDEFFIKDIPSKISDNTFPGRMSAATALCFSLIGLAFLNLRSTSFLMRISMQWALHIVTFIAAIDIMSYLYKMPGAFKIPVLSSMAIHTAALFFILSIAASLINPTYGVVNLFSGNKIGNTMAKRLFPTIAILLLGVNYVRMEVARNHLLDKQFINILFTAFFLLLSLFLIWRTAVQLNKIDIKRKIAEESISILNKNLEKKVEQRTRTLKETLRQLEKTQQEVNEALSKEKEMNEMKSRFVSMASHEFKTPLSTILSSASLISNYVNPQSQPQREKHVQRIKNSVKHLNDLLEDFLSLGRLDENLIRANAVQFDLKEFLEDTMEEMKINLRKGQQIQLRQDGLADFITDRRLLKNIFLNIISNAIKFSPEQSIIMVQVNNTNDKLFITVSDSGIGISEDDQKHLFNSFFRGNNTLNIEGTGLGLHIVKRYINLLKGTVAVQSELKKGTTIKIELPHLPKEALSSILV